MKLLSREKTDYTPLSDDELASRIAAKDLSALRLVTARNNQRLFRTAWSVLKDGSEAEEAFQDGDLIAGRSSLSTWLKRIVVNDALSGGSRTQSRSQLTDAHRLDERAVSLMLVAPPS